MKTVIIPVLFLLLVWVSVHDLKTRKIENYVHPFIMAAGFLINNLTVTERLAGAVICFVPLLIVSTLSKNGFGMGDVKLAGAFGFVLGVNGGLFAVIAGLSLMLLTAGVYQLCLKIKKAVPLAPFLCGGFALILIGTM